MCLVFGVRGAASAIEASHSVQAHTSSEKAHKADQNEGTNIDDDPGLIGGTHVVKAHSADETAEAIAERLASRAG